MPHFLEQHRAAVTAATISVQCLGVCCKPNAGHRAFESAFRAMRQLDREVALGQAPNKTLKILRELVVARIGDELVEITGNRPDVFGDAPFVVVEDADEFLRRVTDVVHRLEGMPLVSAASPKMQTTFSFVPRLSRAAAMPSAADSAVPAWPAPKQSCSPLGAQGEAVQAVRLPDGAEAIFPAGQILWTYT